jgi:hypothetical protein
MAKAPIEHHVAHILNLHASEMVCVQISQARCFQIALELEFNKARSLKLDFELWSFYFYSNLINHQLCMD